MATVKQDQLQTQEGIRQCMLGLFRQRASQIVIRTAQDYITAAQVLADLKAYVKDCKRKRDDELEPLKSELDRKKNEWATFIAPAETLVLEVGQKTDAFKAEEKRQAQVEQDRKNAELARQARENADADRKESERQAAEATKARVAEINGQLKRGDIGKREAAQLLKAAGAAELAAIQAAEATAEEAKNAPPPQVAVRPNIPTVAGVKNQTYWFSEPINPGALLIAYDKALRDGDKDRAAFLSRFVMVDEKEVGKFARATQDNAKAASLVPGFRFWSKG